jgi:lambda family phage minor tail protein L
MTATPVAELQKPNPSAIIELFEIQLTKQQHGTDTTYRFHPGTNETNNGDVVWAGNSYIKMPLKAEGFEYSGKGLIPRPTIAVSNLLGTLTLVIQGLPYGLNGAKVTRIRTMARFLDAVNFDGGVNPYGTPDPTQKLPDEIYYVDRKKGENRETIEFELTSSIDLQGVAAPKRQTIQNVCQWKYRTTGEVYAAADYVEDQYAYFLDAFNYDQVDCPYKGGIYFKADDTITTDVSLDQCGKRLSSCKKRFGFIELKGTATKDSAILSIDSGQADLLGLVDAATAPRVQGFGIPDDTTVLSKTATTLTLSAVCDGTATVVESGKIANSGLVINMTNNPATAGIKAGMTVSGAMVPEGTIVKKVKGGAKQVFLGIDNNEDVLTVVQPVGYVEFFGADYVASGYVSDTSTVIYIDDINTALYVENGYILDAVDGVYSENAAGSACDLTLSDTSNVQVNDFVIGPDIYAKTKVKNKVTNTKIRLKKKQEIVDQATVSFGVYEKVTKGFTSYTFTASDIYVVRPQDGLPFGSFPGVGQFK